MRSRMNASEYRTYGKSRSVRLPPESYRVAGAHYFVTCCCRSRQPGLQDPAIANAVMEAWWEAAARCAFRLWALCVMPDHVHAMVEATDETSSLSDVVRGAKMLCLGRTRSIGRLRWQRRFHDHALRERENPVDTIAYVINNPVRRGLVEAWQDWPFSYVDPDAAL